MSRQARKKWAVAAAAFILAAAMGSSTHAQQNQQQPPAEYYQLMGQANYAFKHANNKADYEEAVKLFQQAVNAAPWLPDTYYDLGKAQQNAEQFNDAIGSLQRYLQLKPDANDRDKVNAEIEELQGEAKQASAHQQSEQEFTQSLNGADMSTALVQAAKDGHLDMVKALLAHGANVDAKGEGGNTALICAAIGDHLDVAQFLVEHGADVNARQNGGDTALIFAASDSHLDMVQFLLEHGADVNARATNGITALYAAIPDRRPLDVVQFLVEHGADVNAQDSRGWTILYLAHGFGSPEVENYLRSHGAQ